MRKTKTYWKAVATLRDSEKEWEVIIYSHYESEEEAQSGIDRFCAIKCPTYEVIATRIEKNIG